MNQPHTVTAVHITHTDRDYTTLTITGSTGTARITSTTGHPYWDATTHTWTPAGDHLQTPTGHTGHTATILTITGHNTTTTYNLTIDGVHTYYVQAGTTPVLVHNCGLTGGGPNVGQTVYRVFGGDSKMGGASWSPVDPRTVPNYRDAAGLPSGGASGATNTGEFVIEGVLQDTSKVVLTRSALPLDGMKGGISEYIIPNWMVNGAVQVVRISGVNPPF